MTSHDVVARVRRVLGGAKVGHAGTLDPDATGVLVLCVGKATKLSAFLMEGRKVYAGVGRLGIATDTQDATGRTLSERPVTCTEAELRAAAMRFVGRIEQVPPMFSAVKVEGKKLYQLARRGVEVERAARPVTVHDFDITRVDLPDFEFSLSCSKGTYVRTVVHDLGEVLGCGAHLLRLAREAQGAFPRSRAVPFDVLDTADAAATLRAALLAPADAFADLPAVELDRAEPVPRAGAVLAGPAAGRTEPGLVRLISGGRLAALARSTPEGLRVLHVVAGGATYGRPGRTA